MNQLEKLIDRRGYERRAVTIQNEGNSRAPSESVKMQVQDQLIKKYGEGWELESVCPGCVTESPQVENLMEGQVFIFKRRRQLRDE